MENRQRPRTRLMGMSLSDVRPSVPRHLKSNATISIERPETFISNVPRWPSYVPEGRVRAPANPGAIRVRRIEAVVMASAARSTPRRLAVLAGGVREHGRRAFPGRDA